MIKIENKPDNCMCCGVEFGTMDEKGKIIKYHAKGFCRRCYNNIYEKKTYQKKEKVKATHCVVCGKEFDDNLKLCSKAMCRACYYIYNKSAIKKPKVIKPPKQLKTDKQSLDRETKETIRRLLNKFKYGIYDEVDIYILLDLYIYLSKKEQFVDIKIEKEIIAMLKFLKKIYDDDK